MEEGSLSITCIVQRFIETEWRMNFLYRSPQAYLFAYRRTAKLNKNV
jgi:hypothetical protein